MHACDGYRASVGARLSEQENRWLDQLLQDLPPCCKDSTPERISKPLVERCKELGRQMFDHYKRERLSSDEPGDASAYAFHKLVDMHDVVRLFDAPKLSLSYHLSCFWSGVGDEGATWYH